MSFSQFPIGILTSSKSNSFVMCASIRILQQNVAGCEIAADSLKCLSFCEEADLLAVQDLVCHDGDYDQAFAPYRVVTSEKIEGTALAAIAITNPHMKVCEVEELCTKYSVCVSVESQIGELYVLNVCLPASDEIDEALEVMDTIICQLEGEMFVVTVNTNAKSVWWSCNDNTDERGGKIEDFILRHTLCVLNCKDPLGDRLTPEGHTDVILCSSSVVNTLMKWMALDGVTGNRVARTDLMLQDLTWTRKPKKCVKNKTQEMDSIVEEHEHSSFGFEDNSLTSVEGSTSRWSEADMYKVGMMMKKCRLTGEVEWWEYSSSI